MQAIALELYELENQRPLSKEQTERWHELAAIVFARSHPGEQRTSSRLRGPARVQINGRMYEVVDVSWSGLKIAGAQTMQTGDCVKLLGVRRDGGWYALDLQCRVTQVRDDSTAALNVIDADQQRRHDYFVRAYYPLYMEHLRTLAQSA